ncbi:major facilitator superfamily domain-containing protein [Hyaloscypha sp. PMI_1271]|nr:major facilitator superfamily domain-containing protein [Hyaloscypha sp. PMI_1271]
MASSSLIKLRSFLWGNDPKDASLLIKLDFTILPYFSLIWFLFGLSRASYGSAYISGMGADLGFKGKGYNYMNTVYLAFYAVCQMPGTSLLTIAPPKYVVGAHFIYGSWYKKSELGTRAAIFVSCGQLGSMAGGWIQAGLLESLAGKNGLPAWRWLFIIVGILTIPIAIFGWVFIPDLPSHRSAWYLTEEEKEHAAVRLGQPKQNTWDMTLFKRVLFSWQFWLLPTIFMRKLEQWSIMAGANTATVYSLAIQMELNNVMQLWLASRGYAVVEENNYPTAVYGAAIVGTVFYSFISDKIQSRWQCSLAIGVTFIIGSTILIGNPRADAGHFFAFYLLGTTYAPQALWYSWMADWPLIFYPVTDAPNYRKGYIASIITGALVIPTVLVIAYLEKQGIKNGTLGRKFDTEEMAGDESVEADTEQVPLPEKA